MRLIIVSSSGSRFIGYSEDAEEKGGAVVLKNVYAIVMTQVMTERGPAFMPDMRPVDFADSPLETMAFCDISWFYYPEVSMSPDSFKDLTDHYNEVTERLKVARTTLRKRHESNIQIADAAALQVLEKFQKMDPKVVLK